jgi:AcrR family transcriptional regulator
MARKGFSEKERRARREEILDAAQSLFEEQGGIEAVSFRNVASVMGCSYTAPYRYFSGKDELLTALRARAFRGIERAMLAVIDLNAPARQQLETLAAAYIEFGMARPNLYALMFFELPNTDIAQRSMELKAAKRDALDVCTRVIAAGQGAGELPGTIDALTASHVFWAGAHGLVSLQVGEQFVMGRSVRQLVPVLVQWLRTGLEQHEAGTRPVSIDNENNAVNDGGGLKA